MKSLLLIIPILFIVSILSFSDQAYAKPSPHYNMTLIILSETCKRTNHYNVTSDCPKIYELIKFDTSNQNISGKFVKNGNDYERTKPQMKNHWVYYQKNVICVDCNIDYIGTGGQFKSIIIEPNNFTWIDKDAVLKNTLKWTSYSNRFVSGCQTATIAYSDSLLNDTISYLNSECTKTNFNGNKINTIQDHPFSFDNPYSSLHYQSEIASLKSHAIGNCINKICDIKPLNKNW